MAHNSSPCSLISAKAVVSRHIGTEGNYPRSIEPNVVDPRFFDSFGLAQSIVVSTAQNDSGLFETNFRDERYLPFENAGAISTWKLRLPADPRNGITQFDYETISDVVLHLRYTARDGGEILQSAATESLKVDIEAANNEASKAGFTRLFSMRQEFPTEWAKLKNQVVANGSPRQLTVNIRKEHFPFWARGSTEGARIRVFVKSTEVLQSASITLEITSPESHTATPITLAPHEGKDFGDLFVVETSEPLLPLTGTWQFTFHAEVKAISDVWVTTSNASGILG
jgi:hypothetical protein